MAKDKIFLNLFDQITNLVELYKKMIDLSKSFRKGCIQLKTRALWMGHSSQRR